MKETGRVFYGVLALLLVLMVWGGYSWVRIMFIDGVGITGSSDLVPWGVFIVGFVFFVGTRSEERRVGKECRSRWSP